MVGCWTCRVRKKRCGQQVPSCDECDRLGLRCDGYSARPFWADGGQREQGYKISLKKGIKQRLRYRRKQSLSERPDTPPQTSDALVDETDATDNSDECLTTPFTFPQNTPFVELQQAFSLLPIEAFTTTSRPLYSPMDEAAPYDIQDAYFADSADVVTHMQENVFKKTTDLPAQISVAEEYRLLSYYLDSVFWRQHPRLEQTIAAPDRSWVLVLFHSSQMFKEALLHVSRYLYGQRDDKILRDADVRDSITVRGIIGKINDLANDLVFTDGTLLLTSTIPLLAATGLTAYYGFLTCDRDCLNGSLMVSRALLEHIRQSEESFRVCLNSNPTGWETNHVLAAALQTSYTQLLWLDAIEAATMGSPCLLELHLSVDELCVEPPVEYMFGCRYWILRAFRQAIELREWKKVCLMNGCLSMFELNRRSTKLLEQINQCQMSKSIERSPSIGTVASDDPWTPPQDPDISHARAVSSAFRQDDMDIISRVYAQAISTYLQVVVLGANPGLLEIQSAIATALDLLGQLRHIDSLACLQWPLMIFTCLSTQSQRQRYKSILAKAERRPKLQQTCSRILEVAQKFWQLTDEMSTMTWDWENVIHKIYGHTYRNNNSLWF